MRVFELPCQLESNLQTGLSNDCNCFFLLLFKHDFAMTYNNEYKKKKKTVMKNTLIGISKTEQKKTSLH